MKKITRQLKKKTLTEKNDNISHYNAILLEDVRSKLEIVIESTQTTRTELKQEMKILREDLSGRMDIVEGVLRHHSVGIQKLNIEVSGLKTDVASLKTDVASLKTDVTGLKTDVAGFREEMRGMEQRLSIKISSHTSRLDDHKGRITTLEEASQP